MRRVGPIGFEETLLAAMDRDGPIRGNDADGFQLHLEHVFRELETLTEVEVHRTEETDCRFRVTASYDGEVSEAVAAVLDVLENEVTSLRYDSIVAVDSSIDPIGVRCMTGVRGVGVATVCVEARPRRGVRP